MARGRFLSKTISTNERLGYAGERPALAFFLGLPHADVHGCLPGSIAELAMTCFPVATNFFGWTHETIWSLICDLSRTGFWRLVKDDLGQPAIYIERFKDHQKLRDDREGDSKYVFSQSVDEYYAVPSEEWRELARKSRESLPPKDGVTPAKTWSDSGVPRPQVQGQVQEEVEVQVQGDPPSATPRRREPKNPDEGFDSADVDRFCRLYEERHLARYHEDLPASSLDRHSARENLPILRRIPIFAEFLDAAFDFVEDNGGPRRLCDLIELKRKGKLEQARDLGPAYKNVTEIEAELEEKRRRLNAGLE